MHKKLHFVLGCFFALTATAATAQQTVQRKLFQKSQDIELTESGHIRCGSHEYEQYLQSRNKDRATDQAFENWIAPKIEALKKERRNNKSAAAVITIPVVIHILHNGQAVGVGSNISDLRAQSQITVLNQDFRKMLNTNGYNTEPAGADVEIEFCLAQQDPNGLPTTGITRKATGPYSSNLELEVRDKEATIWNPDKYMNIWVVEYAAGVDLLGYAQFPSNSNLGGLNTIGGEATTDGVVINYAAFGSAQIAPGTYSSAYNLGRTTTHEVGHYLGLRHIWGDNNSCTVNAQDSFNDYCLDTPAAARANSNCRVTYDSCPNSPGFDMTNNYMDYSIDSCLNTFTEDQKNRMITVMNNATRRSLLKTSNACQAGQVYGLNAGIKFLKASSLCKATFEPQVVLKNYGTTTLTTASISYQLNGTPQVYNWTGNLAQNQEALVSLPQIQVQASANNNFRVEISTVNGTTDQYIDNNKDEATFQGFDSDNTYNITSVTLKLKLDDYANETKWEFRNNTTNTIVSSGAYTTANNGQLITSNLPVQTNNCYTFLIYDNNGDGICCGGGFGNYTLVTSQGTQIANSDFNGKIETVDFRVGDPLSTETKNRNLNLYVYPNPVNNVLQIHNPEQIGLYNFRITNNLGQQIKIGTLESEMTNTIDVSKLATGIYYLNVLTEGPSKTFKFIKQ